MKKPDKTVSMLLSATVLLWLICIPLYSQTNTGPLFEKALFAEEVKGDLSEALELYTTVLKENPANRRLAAQALLHMGICYEKLGSEEARMAYRDVINKYAEQTKEVALARERMIRLDLYQADLNAKAEEHMKKGNDLFKQWEYEEAILEYEKALQTRPNSSLAMNAQYFIGQSLFRAGKYDASMTTLTNLIEDHPKSAIAPVTDLMLAQVHFAMENERNLKVATLHPDGNSLFDPETGINYQKIKTFAGRNDHIGYLSGGANMSPDCRFMVMENKVVPLDGGDPFTLVDMDALRAIYAPGMEHAAFLADSAIWIVPVSPETGKSTGQPSKLLKGGYRFQNPVNWSPDGRKIAFTRVEESMELDIWTLSIDHGEFIRLTNSPEIENSPCWSPDGKSIAYRGGGGIWLTSANGKDNKMILPNGGRPWLWSPDSKWLFHSDWEYNHMYSLEQDKNIQFSIPEQVGHFVSFSPDRQSMLFYRSSSDAVWPIKLVSASGGASYKPYGNEEAYGASWLGDSQHILVQGENEQGQITMKILGLAGGNPVNINIPEEVNGEVLPFGFLPGNTHMAYTVRKAEENKDIFIAPFSVQEARITGPARKIFENWTGGAFNVTTSWAPNDKKLALVHEGDIWVVPLENENPVRLTRTPDEERWVDWSPDGTWISYKVFDQSDKSETLHVINPETGMSRKVFKGCNRESVWSSDSKSIFLFTKEEIIQVSLDGEIRQHLLNLNDLGLEITESPCLSPDGKHVAFIGYDRDEGSYILSYSFDTKKITRLADDIVDDYKYSLKWSPDGKWLSYLTYEEIKVRPESALWEADFEEIIERLSE